MLLFRRFAVFLLFLLLRNCAAALTHWPITFGAVSVGRFWVLTAYYLCDEFLLIERSTLSEEECPAVAHTSVRIKLSSANVI